MLSHSTKLIVCLASLSIVGCSKTKTEKQVVTVKDPADQEAIANLESQVSELGLKANDTQTSASAQSASDKKTIDHLNQEIAALKESISSTPTVDVNTSEPRVVELLEFIDTNVNTRTKIAAAKESASVRRLEAQGHADQASASVKAQESQIATLQAEKAVAEKEFNDASAVNADLKSKVDGLQKSFDDNFEVLELVTAEKEVAEQELAEVSATKADLEESLRIKEIALAKLNEKIADTKARQSEAVDDEVKAALELEINRLQSEAVTLTTQIDGHKTHLASVNEDFAKKDATAAASRATVENERKHLDGIVADLSKAMEELLAFETGENSPIHLASEKLKAAVDAIQVASALQTQYKEILAQAESDLKVAISEEEKVLRIETTFNELIAERK